METARIIVEVTAGLIPNKPMSEYTKQWSITSNEWYNRELNDYQRAVMLAELNGKAQGYAGYLMMQPDRINWVRTDWLYL